MSSTYLFRRDMPVDRMTCKNVKRTRDIMINVKRFTCNMIRENCYVVSDPTKECVIIDCGAYYPEERNAVVDYIREQQLKPVHLLATHGHIDHNFGDNTIYKEFGLKPEVSQGDEGLMADLNGQAMKLFGLSIDIDFPPVGRFIDDGDVIHFGTHDIKVIATPGHTAGGVTFYLEDEATAFTGDTLFHQSIGRTDTTGGSMFMIINSLRELAQLPDETIVYPGHGAQTTIGWEVAHNPYMDR